MSRTESSLPDSARLALALHVPAIGCSHYSLCESLSASCSDATRPSSPSSHRLLTTLLAPSGSPIRPADSVSKHASHNPHRTLARSLSPLPLILARSFPLLPRLLSSRAGARSRERNLADVSLVTPTSLLSCVVGSRCVRVGISLTASQLLP